MVPYYLNVGEPLDEYFTLSIKLTACTTIHLRSTFGFGPNTPAIRHVIGLIQNHLIFGTIGFLQKVDFKTRQRLGFVQPCNKIDKPLVVYRFSNVTS